MPPPGSGTKKWQRTFVRDCTFDDVYASHTVEELKALAFSPRSTGSLTSRAQQRLVVTADFSVLDPQRMMCTYGPAEGSTQSFVHAWLVWVNINAIRCKTLGSEELGSEDRARTPPPWGG